MRNMVGAIAALVLLVGIGSVGAKTRTCYVCEQREKPVWSECWNASESLQTVECQDSCFSSMFQSGGNSLENYWNVQRGCSKTCKHSENCYSQHYGECEFCCKGNLCNNFVNSRAIVTRLSLPLMALTAVFVIAEM